jgi:hypothetical protein
LTNRCGSSASPTERRAAALQVRAHRGDRLAADGHEALLGALAARAQHAGLDVEVGERQVDRLRRAQPQAYMTSSSARSRRACGSVPRGAASRRWTSARPSTCGSFWLLRGARRSAVGSRSSRPLPAQVAVEGAQAGGLALQRRRGDRRAVVVALREVGEEAGEVRVLGVEDVDALALEVGPELQQVGPVGLQRVARQAPLELEVAEEVEDVVLEGADGEGGHGPHFAAGGYDPPAASGRSGR